MDRDEYEDENSEDEYAPRKPKMLEAPSAPSQAGASSWDGILAVRVLARDGEALLAAVRTALEPLREGRALPRVWKC